MGQRVKVGDISEMPPGSMMEVKSGGASILLANISGQIYAIENTCPHMGGVLSQGKLAGSIVTCPLHGSQIDVTTGQVVRWLKGSGISSTLLKTFKPHGSVRQYKVTVVDNKVTIET